MREAEKRELLQSMAVPVLAIFTALAVSAVLILLSDVKVLTAYANVFNDPGAALCGHGQGRGRCLWRPVPRGHRQSG